MMFINDRNGVYLEYYAPDPSQLIAEPEQFMGRNFHDFFSDKLAEKFQSGMDDLFEGKIVHPIEYELIISGELRYFEARLVSIDSYRILSIIRDITQRKQFEKELKDSEEQNKRLIAHLNPGVVVYGPGTEILLCNKSACNLVGLSMDQMLGKTSTDTSWCFVKEDGTTFSIDEYPVNQVIRSRKPVKDLVLGIEHPARLSITWVLVNGYPEFDSNNKLQQVVLTYMNITDRKNDETEIKRINEQLVLLNETKDKFFSIIAHDLKTPFNTILGYTSLLLENYQQYQPKDIEKYLENINNSSQQAYTLLENLLIWARTQSGHIDFQPEVIDLQKMVEKNIKLVEGQAQKKGQILSIDIEDSCIIIADKNMMDTILRNLLTNAIKFTPQSGMISVIGKSQGDYIEIQVKDSGVGIQNADLSDLFRIDRKINTPGTANEKGSGLGLLLCKEFIERHGGKIMVESEPGRGSVFTIFLPQ